MQLARDIYELLRPQCPGSGHLPAGWGTPKLAQCCKGTHPEPSTARSWFGSTGARRKRRRGRLTSQHGSACVSQLLSSFQTLLDSPWTFGIQMLRPFPKPLTSDSTPACPHANPLRSLPAQRPALIFTQDEPRSGSVPADIQSLSFLQIPLRFLQKEALSGA